jgi:hypothetical protein
LNSSKDESETQTIFDDLLFVFSSASKRVNFKKYNEEPVEVFR